MAMTIQSSSDFHSGSVNVDFEVEASGSDSSAITALETKTGNLQNELKNGGVNLTIGGETLAAPEQNISIATVDVTPAVNQTYPFTFKVI